MASVVAAPPPQRRDKTVSSLTWSIIYDAAKVWDFSGDEFLFLLISAVVAAAWGVPICFAAVTIGSLGRSRWRRAIVLFAPFVLMVPTLITLNTVADPQVVNHLDYNVLFLLGQLALLAIGARAMPLLGVHVRDDGIDRDNPAALVAVGGVLLGTSLIYALANIGSGPTIWTTIVPAAVGIAALWLLGMVVTACGGDYIDAITIDRDVASAVRFGGATVAMGLMLGRAAAGNWTDWDKTIEDLEMLGWPAIVPAALAIGLQWRLKPRHHLPRPTIVRDGVVPAAGMIAVAIVVICVQPHGWKVRQW